MILKKGLLQNFKNYFYHLPKSILANVIYCFPAKSIKLIGITGTDGKTTTASLTYHLLTKAKIKTGLVTTISAKIGKTDWSTGLHTTSPEPFQLQKLIRSMVNNKTKYGVLEVTSHGLDQFRFWGCNFDLAAITNVTHEHLDYHKTWQNYLETKAKLLKSVNDFSIINLDDKSYEPLLKILDKNKIITYGLSKEADIYAKDIKMGKNGYQFIAVDKYQKIKIETNLLGEFNIYNCLAALTIARKINLSWENIAKSIKSFYSPKGRMEFVKNNLGLKIIIDFAHTPNALKQALKTAKFVAGNKKIIAVFGAAGLRDQNKRPLMGKFASELADKVVLTAEDPRTENVNKIIHQIKKGFVKKTLCYEIPDRNQAINTAINKLAKKGDVVIICGKGHEQSMCFGTEETSWSEHKAVRRALSK